MPSDSFLKGANHAHRLLQRISFGKIGWNAGKMPVVELTTMGRKSGLPRTVLLTSPIQEGDAVVIVASKGGDDDHPAWFLSLRDHPEVEVVIKGGPQHTRHARIATAEERERMWPQVTAAYRGYAGYQTKTSREIPLVILER